MGVQDARRFRFLIMLVAIAGVALAFHLFAYLPHARNDLHLRNQRALAATARTMEARLQGLPHLMRSSLGSYASGECDPRKSFDGPSMKAFSVVDYGSSWTDCGVSPRGDVVTQVLDNNIVELTLARSKPLKVRVDVGQLLAQQTSEIFDSVVVASRFQSAEHPGFFVLQQPSGGALPLSPLELEEALHPPKSKDDKQREPGLGRIRIGPSSYWVYGRPLVVDPAIHFEVFALVHETSFESQVEKLPLGATLVALTVLSLLVLAFPYLKLILIGAREPLRRMDVYFLLSSAMVSVALITLLVLGLGFQLDLRHDVDLRLADTATRMRDALDRHLEHGLDSLQPFTKGASPPSVPIPPTPCLPTESTFRATVPEGYEQVVAVDGRGCQVAKVGGGQTHKITPLIWIGDREYFMRSTSGQLNSRRHFAFDLDVVRSRNTGDAIAMLSVERKVASSNSDTVDDLVDASARVVQLTSRLNRFLNVSEVEGLEAAIVASDGRVLFHSRRSRSGTEQILQETTPGSGLDHVLRSGYATQVRTTYHGVPRTMVVRPLDGTPWRLVLISDNRLVAAINAEVATNAALHIVLLLGFVSVLGFAVFWWRMKAYWLWPQRGAERRYWLATGLLALLSCAMVCLSAPWPWPHTVLKLATVLAAMQLFGPFIVYGVLRREIQPHGTPWNSLRPRSPDRPVPAQPSNRVKALCVHLLDSPASYLACALALLTQMSIVPAGLLFLQSVGDVQEAWEQHSEDLTMVHAGRTSSVAQRPLEPRWIPTLLPRSTPYLAGLRTATLAADPGEPTSLISAATVPASAYLWRDLQALGFGKSQQESSWYLGSRVLFVVAFTFAALIVFFLALLPARRIFGYRRGVGRTPRFLRADVHNHQRVLYVGGAGRPSPSASTAELRVALHPDVDLPSVVGTLSVDIKRIVLTELHAALWRPQTRRSLLTWLRLMTARQDLDIELYSQVNPAEWLLSHHRGEARQSRLGLVKVKHNDKESLAEGGMTRPDVREWSDLLTNFTIVLDTASTVVQLETRLAKLTHGDQDQQLSEFQRSILVRECGWHARLHSCAEHVARLLLAAATSGTDLNKGSVEKRIVEMVTSHAMFEHRYIFSAYSREQKLLLAYVAEESFANPSLWHEVIDLEEQGVLVRDPSLRLRSRSFARFLRRELAGEDIERLEQAEPSRWAYVRAAAGAAVLVGLVGVFWLEPAIGGTMLAALSPALAGVTGISKLFGGSGDGVKTA